MSSDPESSERPAPKHEPRTAPPSARVLAWAAAGAALAMLMLGNVVWGTGSSLACPDWPTCYGSFVPPMRGGILFEHSHRLLGAATGVLILLLAWRLRRARAGLRRASRAAIGLVVIQGVLGGVTVLLRLPAPISVGHLGLGVALFCLLAAIAWHTGAATGATAPIRARTGIIAALAMTYVQILLGGVVRHTGAAFACTDLPFCNGAFWPGAGQIPARIHVLHRGFALVVLCAVLSVAVWIRRTDAVSGGVRRLALVAASLATLQVSIGAVAVLFQLQVAIVTVHMGVAALLVATLLILAMHSGRVGTREGILTAE